MAREPRSKAQTKARTSRVLTALTSFALVAVALLTLGGCGSSRGEEVRANVATFERDQRPERLVELGKAFARVGDLTRAEQYFSAALDAGADGSVVVPMLLQVCIRDGRYRAALEYGELHLRKHPTDVRTRFVVATVYSGLGESEPAKKHLERVIEERPAQADAHFALGVLMRESLKDPVGADRHFREYLKLSPKGAHAEEAQASLLKTVP
jgi:tetratricopeptide (TPR) repeat protein